MYKLKKSNFSAIAQDDFELEADDPFDTTFAENILPGKAELKLIEKDILDNDVDFNPRAPASIKHLKETDLFKERIPGK